MRSARSPFAPAPITRAAVRRYQQARGLLVDGVAGPQTLGALGLPTDVTLGEDAPFAGASTVVSAMRSQIGKPYAWGGNGPSSWDCSGLTVWAFRAVGISLPRTTYGQVGMGAWPGLGVWGRRLQLCGEQGVLGQTESSAVSTVGGVHADNSSSARLPLCQYGC